MVQLRELAAIPEDPGFQPQHPHDISWPDIYNTSFKESKAFIWLLTEAHTCDGPIYMQEKQLYEQNNKINFKKQND